MPASLRFPSLAVPTVCTTDAAQITAQSIIEYEQDFQAIQGIAKSLAPGDPVRLLLLRSAARESQIRNIINFAFQQNFIINAIGGNLDAIGSNYGPRGARLQASPALTTLQFSIASAINTDIDIPIGAGGSSAGSVANLSFITTTDTILLAGQTSIQIPAQCSTAGAIGNGLAPGQINQVVGFNLPFVIQVTNVTETQGGADLESDDAYAQRLALVPGSFSVAGPALAYQFWGRTANTSVMDVSVVGPPTTPAGTVNLYILLQGGIIPTSSVLAQITSFFQTQAIRPMTDVVNILAPIITNYNVVGTYWIDPSMATLVPQIQLAVTNAVTQFNTETQNKIGKAINPEYLGQLLMEAGASDYQLTQPIRTLLGPDHLGVQTGTMVLTYGGLQTK